MQGSPRPDARRRRANRTPAPLALLLAVLAPLLAPVRRPGQRIAAWLATTAREHWKTMLIGVATGATYETMTEIQPLANALSASLGASPGAIGGAVIVALVAGIAGTRVFVPLASGLGHRAVQVGMALALSVVMLAAPPAITRLGIAGLYAVAALSGFFARGYIIGHHWLQSRELEHPVPVAFVMTAGLQLGLMATKLADSFLVRGVRWQPGFRSQAVFLLVAAALFAWLMPAQAPASSPASSRRVSHGAARVLMAAGGWLEARAARPKGRAWRRVRALGKPASWAGAVRCLREAATSATRIAFFQQAALWAFDTYVVYLLIAKALDEGALLWVVVPVGITALVIAPFSMRLERWPAITRLISVALIGLAWPEVLGGVLTVERAAFAAVLFTATMCLEPGTTIWTAVGPDRAAREAGDLDAAHKNFDNARTLGAIAGIALGGACLAFGPVGLSLAGCAIGAAAVWDGLLRKSVRRELRHELATLLAARRARRVLPLGDAALLGFATALGRASFAAPAPFLLAVATDVGSGSTTAAKAALAAGWFGYSLGLAVAFRRRGRMVTRPVVLAGYLLAAACGAAAAFGHVPATFAVGVGLLGFAGAIPQLVQAALRERERRAGANTAAVNAEIEAWVLPSTGATLLITAALGFATSWRWALLFVSALVAVVGIASARWAALPAPLPAEARPVTLHRILRRPGTKRRLVIGGAYYGSLTAYYTQLALLLAERGWGQRAVLVIAGLGAVRILAPPIMRRIGVRANDDPYAAAPWGFAWSVPGGLLLAAAPFLPTHVTPLVAVLALGFLIAEGTSGGAWAAIKAQSDRGHDPAATALLLAAAGGAGAFTAGLAIAPLGWIASCSVGLAMGLAAACLSRWPALSWSRHAGKDQGPVTVVTHRAPDGAAWLLAWGRRGRRKAYRLRAGEQLVLAHRKDGVVFGRWTASPAQGTYPVASPVDLGGLGRRAMRWLDMDERRIGRFVWSGDERASVVCEPRIMLGPLAGHFPKQAGVSRDTEVAVYLLDGPDLDEPWVLRSRVHRHPLDDTGGESPPPALPAAVPAAGPPAGPPSSAPRRRRYVATKVPARARRAHATEPAPAPRRTRTTASGPLVMAYCEYGVIPEPGRGGSPPRTTRTVSGTGAGTLVDALGLVPREFIERLGLEREVLVARLRSAYARHGPRPAGMEYWLIDGIQRGQRRVQVHWTLVE
jgi:hypothetical protein